MRSALFKIFATILILAVPFPAVSPVFADSVSGTAIIIKPSPLGKYAYLDRTKTMTVKEYFTILFDVLAEYENVPKSSGYVELKYLNVAKGTHLYSSIQKGVYLDLIENGKYSLPLRKTANEAMFGKMLERLTGEKVTVTAKKALTYGVLFDTIGDLYDQIPEEGVDQASNYGLFNDAYLKLKNEYYDASKVGETELVRGAIEGMAAVTGDKHTVYFPPAESRIFQDDLSGEFEGIGAYVDMLTPGLLKIVSPISGSPAEKAGLKAGDVIIKIDGLDVTESVSLEYAVSKIKGPAGSEVVLRLKRGEETITVTVERAKIEVEYVEYKKLASGVPYVKISMFGEGTLRGFAEAATWIKKNGTDTDKLVIDLRNDPGGSLDEVAGILSYFVPKGEAVVKIRYRDSKSEIVSAGSDDSLSGRKIAILVNAGSASASEIMAGTIKDYLPKTVIVGEKTYGKGSVQNFVPYDDGSSIKYTIAKWFTGKTEIGIDGMGITPDIEVKSASGTVVETGDRALEKAEEALRSIR